MEKCGERMGRRALGLGGRSERRASAKLAGPVSSSKRSSAEWGRLLQSHLVTELLSVRKMKVRSRPSALRTLLWLPVACREKPKSLQLPARPCPADPGCSSDLPQPVSTCSRGSSHMFWNIAGTLVALLPAKLFSEIPLSPPHLTKLFL